MIIFSFSLVIFCWWVFFFFFTLVICSCPFPPFPIAVYLCWSYINLFLNLLPVFSWHSFNCTNCFYVCVVIIGLCYGLTEVSLQFSSVRSLSRVRLFATPGISTPGLLVHHHLLEFTQTHIHRVGDAIQPSHPLSSPFSSAPIPPSIRVFSNESTLHMRWPKYWSFSIIPSKEHPGLISFRMDWLDLLAVQGTLKSLLQHHSSKASILWC